MKTDKLAFWYLIATLLLAIAGAVSMNMTYFWYDEHMYIAASIFVSKGYSLYQDFAYLQMPYLPILYGNLFKILGIESHYLLIGKLFSLSFLTLSSLVLYLLSWRILHDRFLSLGIVILFLLNLNILSSAALATNFIMPVAFSIISFYLFYISFFENRIKLLGIMFAGIFLALAIGTKLTFATLTAPFAMMIICFMLWNKNSSENYRKSILCILFYLTGIIIGLLPVLLFISDLESFIFNNLGFHNFNTQWRQITEFDGPMSLHSKLQYAYRHFFKSDNLILLLAISLGFGLSVKNFQSMRETYQQLPAGTTLTFFLVLIAIVTALIPTPTWSHYYSIPISFLFILLIFSFATDSGKISTIHKRLIIILLFITTVYSGPSFLTFISRLSHEESWTALKLQAISTNMRIALLENNIGTDRKIASLSPMYALESNLSIYPEFSTGPFLYRIGDLLTAQQRDHFVGTSTNSLSELFSKDPPAAIIIGSNEDGDLTALNQPLIEYVIANNYRKIPIAGFSGEFYIMP